MDKEIESAKLTEEEAIDFWNSYYFEQEEKNKYVENNLKKTLLSINNDISQNSLSSAYKSTKYLLNKIAEQMIKNKETIKVAINDGYGSFMLSEEAMSMFAKLKGINVSEINIFSSQFKRHDEDLIKVVEQMGDKANTICSQIKIVEIPKDIDYKINDYDGWEKVVY